MYRDHFRDLPSPLVNIPCIAKFRAPTLSAARIESSFFHNLARLLSAFLESDSLSRNAAP